ncbi:hypothetical protein LCGC14_2214000 [marine sediment metagenome]|uniref:Uncharacterized protein n=1 Tax=marine sediment metagenome TaxID=412755 RepID=A0A0F9FQH0_9ZZZZ
MALQSTPTGGGGLGWVFVNNITMAAVASQAIDLKHGYPVYKLYFSDLVMSADDQFMEFQFNVSGTAQTGSGDYWYIYTDNNNIGTTEATAVLGDESLEAIPLLGATEMAANENPGTDGGAVGYCEMTIMGLGLAKASFVNLTYTYHQGAAQFGSQLTGGTLVAEANDGITILVEGATTVSGSIYIMGLNV